MRSTSQGDDHPFARDLLKRQFELVNAVLPRLIGARRLAGRPHEHPREQVRQRRVIDVVADEAAQQVGPPQERAVGGRGAAQHDVVAATRSGVAPVEHELLGPQPAVGRLLVKRAGQLGHLAPAARRLHVHLQDARIGGDGQLLDAVVLRRLVALDAHRLLAFVRHVLDGRGQGQVFFQPLERRHEDVQDPVTRLHAQRGADRARGRTAPLGRANWLRLGPGDAQRRARLQRIALDDDVAPVLAAPTARPPAEAGSPSTSRPAAGTAGRRASTRPRSPRPGAHQPGARAAAAHNRRAWSPRRRTRAPAGLAPADPPGGC